METKIIFIPVINHLFFNLSSWSESIPFEDIPINRSALSISYPCQPQVDCPYCVHSHSGSCFFPQLWMVD